MSNDYADLMKRLQRIQVGMANEEEDAVLAAIAAIETLLRERDEARAEVKRREDETSHEVVAARDCEKHERSRAEAAEECHTHALTLAKKEMARAEAAEAEVVSLKTQHDAYVELTREAMVQAAKDKAEVARLREALKKIADTGLDSEADNGGDGGYADPDSLILVARAALEAK